jgi:hypothetical protein
MIVMIFGYKDYDDSYSSDIWRKDLKFKAPLNFSSKPSYAQYTEMMYFC